MARMLAENGYEVLAFDMRGHGKSEGRRCYLEEYVDLIQDVNQFIKLTEPSYQGVTSNKFLLGYSFGGTIANLVALQRPQFFKGMILLAPAVFPDFKRKYKFSYYLVSLVTKILPKLGLVKLLNIKNPLIQKCVLEDPFIYKGKIRAKTAVTMAESFDYLSQNLSKVETPYYFLQGKEDKVTPYECADYFYQNTKSQDKNFVAVENLDHFINYDPRIELYAKDMANWMDAHRI